MSIHVKNWKQFQHFKDRRPPWIKLYRELLDDIQWHELEPAAAKALVMLWLIASENFGQLPDKKTIAFRLRISEKALETTVSKLGHWLYQDDTKPISTRYQADTPETETETETYKAETETECAALPPDASKVVKIEPPTNPVWQKYRTAYDLRYHVEPVRNGKVNGMLAKLLDRLPANEAPEVAAFYVAHNRSLYVSAKHAIDLLLRDCEGLRTEWASGKTITDTEARQADRTQATGNAFAPLIAEARAKEANGH